MDVVIVVVVVTNRLGTVNSVSYLMYCIYDANTLLPVLDVMFLMCKIRPFHFQAGCTKFIRYVLCHVIFRPNGLCLVLLC